MASLRQLIGGLVRPDAFKSTASPPRQRPKRSTEASSSSSKEAEEPPPFPDVSNPLFQLSEEKLDAEDAAYSKAFKRLFTPELDALAASMGDTRVLTGFDRNRTPIFKPVPTAYEEMKRDLQPPKRKKRGGGDGGSGGSSGGSGSIDAGIGNVFGRQLLGAFRKHLAATGLVKALQEMRAVVAKARAASAAARALMLLLNVGTLAQCKQLGSTVQKHLSKRGRTAEAREARLAVEASQQETDRVLRQCVGQGAHTLAVLTNAIGRRGGWLGEDVSAAAGAVTAALGSPEDPNLDACMDAFAEHSEVVCRWALGQWRTLVVPQVDDLEQHGVVVTNCFDALEAIFQQLIMQLAGLLGTKARLLEVAKQFGVQLGSRGSAADLLADALQQLADVQAVPLMFQDPRTLEKFMGAYTGQTPMAAAHLVQTSLAHMEQRVKGCLDALAEKVSDRMDQSDIRHARLAMAHAELMEASVAEIRGGDVSPKFKAKYDKFQQQVHAAVPASSRSMLAAAAAEGEGEEDITPQQSSEQLSIGRGKPALVGMDLADQACELVAQLAVTAHKKGAAGRAPA